MHGLLNGINLREEDGDNFMSDYQTYIKYAKKTINELEQLADLKKTFKGKKLAEKIREVGLKWITKSAVDSVLHGLGESSNFSNLNPQQKKVAEKLVSMKDEALTYKSSAIQGVIDENAEMAQSDVTKLIDYSEKLQSMFSVDDNLEDWVKAKLNHACDYVATVRDYLKFYSEEKEKGTHNIEEKWSNTYKKSINCKNPKGFSQQAHCRARKLRQVGKHTKSKPVKECYKEAVQELLKEQNSSMAMGALKQINNDAKELQSMLQPNTQLEDWVKSKLNLAGEYLDDVYHHLDHFGPQGRKLDEILKELDYQGGVGIHEFAVFFQKASKEEEEQMNDCLKTNNVSCVKSLIQKVTGMTMNKIDEGYYDDKEIERKSRQMRFSTIEQREKKYWFTPDGTYEDAGNSHEQWFKNNVPELTGANLVQTYDKAIQKGYIRAIHDISAGTGMLMLSNLKNYGFALEGSTVEGIPAVSPKVVDAIRGFVEEKSVLIVATGKGNILKQFTSIDESELNESFRKTLAALGLAGLTTLGAMKGDAASSEKLVKQKAVQTQTVKKDNSALRSGEVKLLGGKLSDYIANWEGKENEVYKDSAGLPTIGIGHYLTNSEQDKRLFKSLFGNSVNYNKVLNGTQKLENDQVEKLFNVDVKIKEKLAKTKISEFESFPQYIKNAIICGLYRGDLGPKTIGHINSGDWQKASTEYLNHSNARSGPDQIKRRMKTNALAFSHYGKQLDRNK
jgi:GH24 family phage-related lysozyme (muramidase)